MTTEDLETRQRVLSLLRRHGWNATSFQVLEPGFRYFFDGDDACVAHVDTGWAWVAAGAPIAPAERLGAVAASFAAAARAAGRRACFFATEERFAQRARVRVLPVGEQPTWDPADWPASVRASQNLREQLRRARAKGVVVRLLRPDELADRSSPLRSSVDALANRWLGGRPMAPMGFLVDLELFSFPEERRVCVALVRPY